MAPVDPAAIIGDIAELYEPVAEEAGLALAVSAQQGLSLVANRELVSQAVANLVDNAIKYSAEPAPSAAGAAPSPPATPHGMIAISLARVGHSIEIAVADRGPGVAPQDRERALQRFVRLEKSRSRPGAGLGLSLVAAVARMHGGSVRLEDNAPGLRVVLALPMGPSATAPPHGPPRVRPTRPRSDLADESASSKSCCRVCAFGCAQSCIGMPAACLPLAPLPKLISGNVTGSGSRRCRKEAASSAHLGRACDPRRGAGGECARAP